MGIVVDVLPRSTERKTAPGKTKLVEGQTIPRGRTEKPSLEKLEVQNGKSLYLAVYNKELFR